MSLRTDSVSFGGITFSRINISDLEQRPSYSRWSRIRFSGVKEKPRWFVSCRSEDFPVDCWIQEIKQKSSSEPLLPRLATSCEVTFFNKTSFLPFSSL